MCINKDMFVELETYSSEVTLGDGIDHNIIGKGTIAIQSENGGTTYIQDVYYVPSLAQNLLSVGEMMLRGYKLEFDNGECSITDKKTNQLITR